MVRQKIRAIGDWLYGWLDFFVACLRWVFPKWEQGQTIMAYVSPVIVLFLGAGGVVQFLRSDNGWWLAMLVPFCLLLFLIAPYSIWKKANDELVKMKERRLHIEVIPNGILEPTNTSVWCLLKISNDSGMVIEKCYGQLADFAIEKGESKGNTIVPPVSLSWDAWKGTTGEYVTIGPDDKAKLAVLALNNGKCCFPTPGGENLKRQWMGDLTEGVYHLRIKVGSHKHDIQPSTVRLRVVYEKGSLHVSEIKPE